jgi:hypothetical protein
MVVGRNGQRSRVNAQSRCVRLVLRHTNGGGESNEDNGHERRENGWVEDVVVME